jgi:alkanesulfonate monooxygenase SsuD/methylene tetrahydromethanopterin reductase-like flavin-dependent oxidoreductase (luciferase family)
MNFGFVLPQSWGLDEPEDVIDVAVRAEELGFDSIWVNHHVLNVGYIRDRLDDRPYYDSLTVLTWAAAVTTRNSSRTPAPR